MIQLSFVVCGCGKEAEWRGFGHEVWTGLHWVSSKPGHVQR